MYLMLSKYLILCICTRYVLELCTFCYVLDVMYLLLCTHLQVLDESSSVVRVLIDGRGYPDVAIVADDDAGSTRQVVEMRLPPLHKRWGHL